MVTQSVEFQSAGAVMGNAAWISSVMAVSGGNNCRSSAEVTMCWSENLDAIVVRITATQTSNAMKLKELNAFAQIGSTLACLTTACPQEMSRC